MLSCSSICNNYFQLPFLSPKTRNPRLSTKRQTHTLNGGEIWDELLWTTTIQRYKSRFDLNTLTSRHVKKKSYHRATIPNAWYIVVSMHPISQSRLGKSVWRYSKISLQLYHSTPISTYICTDNRAEKTHHPCPCSFPSCILHILKTLHQRAYKTLLPYIFGSYSSSSPVIRCTIPERKKRQHRSLRKVSAFLY